MTRSRVRRDLTQLIHPGSGELGEVLVVVDAPMLATHPEHESG